MTDIDSEKVTPCRFSQWRFFLMSCLAKSLIAEQKITNKLLSDLNDKLEAARKVSL